MSVRVYMAHCVLVFWQVDIQAYDLGEPQLSSMSTLNVYVRHVATVPPEVKLIFILIKIDKMISNSKTQKYFHYQMVAWSHRFDWSRVPTSSILYQRIENLPLYSIFHSFYEIDHIIDEVGASYYLHMCILLLICTQLFNVSFPFPLNIVND